MLPSKPLDPTRPPAMNATPQLVLRRIDKLVHLARLGVRSLQRLPRVRHHRLLQPHVFHLVIHS